MAETSERSPTMLCFLASKWTMTKTLKKYIRAGKMATSMMCE